jgi:hypothetical protein
VMLADGRTCFHLSYKMYINILKQHWHTPVNESCPKNLAILGLAWCPVAKATFLVTYTSSVSFLTVMPSCSTS